MGAGEGATSGGFNSMDVWRGGAQHQQQQHNGWVSGYAEQHAGWGFSGSTRAAKEVGGAAAAVAGAEVSATAHHAAAAGAQ